jgi:hypothetical protein
MKMQISKVRIAFDTLGINNKINSFFSSLEFRWAVDSSGNGTFKHDPVFIYNKKYSKQNIEFNTMSNINSIEIYDLMGRKIKTLSANTNFSNCKEINGIFIVRLIGKGFTRQIKTVITK